MTSLSPPLRRVAGAGLLGALLMLAGCASPAVEQYAAEQPRLLLREYFDGPMTAHGVFTDRSGQVVRRFTAWPVAPAAQQTKPTTRKTTPARDVLKNSSAARDGAPQRAHSAAPARWWLTTSHCIRPKDTMEPTTSNAAVWLRLGRRPKFAPPENGYVHAVWASMIETLA